MTSMRRNRDGSPHLGDLRRLLDSRDDACLFSRDSQWVSSQYTDGFWRETPLGPWRDERSALCFVLGVDEED